MITQQSGEGFQRVYDLIGDTHGCAQTLAALLEKMGYQYDGGCYRHPQRQVIFLGDFIDRGPYQRETIAIAMAMVQSGAALAVMGNHEFNALAYATEDPDAPGHYLRPHNDKNDKQHKAFLDAYTDDPDGKAVALAWFRTLPLWLDLDALRVVHACWHPLHMSYLKQNHLVSGRNALTEQLLIEGSRKGSAAYKAVETLLKGVEVPLPAGQVFHDKDGHPRSEVRVKWWKRLGNFRELAIGLTPHESDIPEDEIPQEHLISYAVDEKPLFLGHYWLQGEPAPLTDNIACLDYSVAKRGGKLVAYRWYGEKMLDARHFEITSRLE